MITQLFNNKYMFNGDSNILLTLVAPGPLLEPVTNEVEGLKKNTVYN